MALAIFAVAAGVPFMVLESSTKAYRAGATIAEIDSAARNGLQRMTEVFSSAGLASVAPPGVASPLSASALEFQRAVDFTAGAVVWSPTERIEFQYSPGDPDDGIDNDGNGLVDEGRVVWIQDLGLPSERRTTLCNGVREWLEGETPGNGNDDNDNQLIDERGLAFHFEGERLRIHLTLERVDAQRQRMTQTVETSVAFRIKGP